MEPITLKYLAKKLNLSVPTVSKAFRNSRDISPETKARILSLAEKLNYQPNPIASSLRTHKTKTIALIIPEIANNFFAQAIKGIESVAQKEGYHVLIYLTHEDQKKELAYAAHLQSGRVDGVLISVSGTSTSNHLTALTNKGIPVVFFDRVTESVKSPVVTTNNFESAYNATSHLIEQGCRKIIHLTTSKEISIAEQRRNGYLQALKDHAISINKKNIITCSDNKDDNLVLIKRSLLNTKTDGIFSSFEHLAMQTYQVCDELKLSIPEKIKIVTFSNLEIAELLSPSLTTITQPAFQMGEKASEILFQMLNNEDVTTEYITINSTLHKRMSTQQFI